MGGSGSGTENEQALYAAWAKTRDCNGFDSDVVLTVTRMLNGVAVAEATTGRTKENRTLGAISATFETEVDDRTQTIEYVGTPDGVFGRVVGSGNPKWARAEHPLVGELRQGDLSEQLPRLSYLAVRQTDVDGEQMSAWAGGVGPNIDLEVLTDCDGWVRRYTITIRDLVPDEDSNDLIPTRTTIERTYDNFNNGFEVQTPTVSERRAEFLNDLLRAEPGMSIERF